MSTPTTAATPITYELMTMCMIRGQDQVPMQPWFRRRFPLFFKPGTFEISMVWDEDKQEKISEKIKQLG